MGNDVCAERMSECSICHEIFSSRNRLFKHLPTCPKQEILQSPQLEEPRTKVQKIHDENQAEAVENIENVFVYVVGGRLRGRTLTAVHKYSVKNNVWELCQPMLENRGSHGAVFLNGILYAIGGGGLHSNLSTCESFDGVEWTRAPALNVSRHALSVTSIGELIYATGNAPPSAIVLTELHP
jgi:hypothetical protein